MSRYKLDTFLTATDGIGYSDKRQFYQTGYGFGFDFYFWIELEIQPPVINPISTGGLITIPPVDIKQIHIVRIYMKTPSGEIVSKRWEINEIFYNIILKYLGQRILVPKFILKQIQVLSDIYKKIKIKLINIT